jgi:hypothetical protein
VLPSYSVTSCVTVFIMVKKTPHIMEKKLLLHNTYMLYKGKAFQLQALGVPGGSGSRISRQSAHEGSKVVSPMHRPSLPPGRIPGTHFC